MRLVVSIVVSGVLLAGCKAAVDLDQARSFQCSVDGGAVVASGEEDPQCPPKTRCGLEGLCHGNSGAPYLCNGPDGPSDRWCETGWRCGPDGRCVETGADELFPRTGAPVTSEPLFGQATFAARDAGVFGVSPNLLRPGVCGFVFGRSASWISGGRMHRIAHADGLPLLDGGVLPDGGVALCELPEGVDQDSAALPLANFTPTDLVDIGTYAVAVGNVGQGRALCWAGWLHGVPLAADCAPIPAAVDFIRAAPSHQVDYTVPGEGERSLEAGSRYLLFGSNWELAAGEAVLGRFGRTAPVLYRTVDAGVPTTPGRVTAALVDLVLHKRGENSVDGGVDDHVMALAADGTLYAAVLDSDLGLNSLIGPAGGGPSPWSSVNDAFDPDCLPRGAGVRPKMLRYSAGGDGLNQHRTYYVAYEQSFNTLDAGYRTYVSMLDLASGLPATSGCAQTFIGSTGFQVRTDRFEVCENGKLEDFIPESQPDGTRGLRAWCKSDAPGPLEYAVLFKPSNVSGPEDVTTVNGRYFSPRTPYFTNPLRFSRSHGGLWAQLDDDGRLWASVEARGRGSDLPQAMVEAFQVDRRVAVMLGAKQRPLLLGEQLALGPVMISQPQGWLATSSAAWGIVRLDGATITPVAGVRNQPNWALSRLSDQSLPMFVIDFLSQPTGRLDGQAGVRVPARLSDSSLNRAPYNGLQVQSGDGQRELLILTVDDSLTSVDVTDVVRNPALGVVNSPAAIVLIPGADVRMTPVNRGPIISIAPDLSTRAFAAGYLIAGGRLFKYDATNAQLWRSTEVFTDLSQPISVVSQARSGGPARVRAIDRDGRVLGLPSRTTIAEPLSSEAGILQAVSACGELLAVTEGGMFFLGAAGWQPIASAARFQPDRSKPSEFLPSLHVVADAVILSDSEGALFEVVAPGGCP